MHLCLRGIGFSLPIELCNMPVDSFFITSIHQVILVLYCIVLYWLAGGLEWNCGCVERLMEADSDAADIYSRVSSHYRSQTHTHTAM